MLAQYLIAGIYRERRITSSGWRWMRDQEQSAFGCAVSSLSVWLLREFVQSHYWVGVAEAVCNHKIINFVLRDNVQKSDATQCVFACFKVAVVSTSHSFFLKLILSFSIQRVGLKCPLRLMFNQSSHFFSFIFIQFQLFKQTDIDFKWELWLNLWRSYWLILINCSIQF